jgi:hypothetical protein
MSDGQNDKRDDRRDLGFLASRFIRAGAEAVVHTSEKIREKGEELNPRDLMRGAAGLTSRGKDEIVAMIAREVRNYVDHLGLVDELERLASTYSLEVSASFRLKPLAEAQEDDQADSDSGGVKGETGEEATSPSRTDSKA